jgi:hypothetical protein
VGQRLRAGIANVERGLGGVWTVGGLDKVWSWGIFQKVRWEDGGMKLTGFAGKAKRVAGRAAEARTLIPGTVNGRGQEVVERTGAASASFPGQTVYRMKCRGCGGEYGANGCDVWSRRCPLCQGGRPGEGLRERVGGLFG